MTGWLEEEEKGLGAAAHRLAWQPDPLLLLLLLLHVSFASFFLRSSPPPPPCVFSFCVSDPTPFVAVLLSSSSSSFLLSFSNSYCPILSFSGFMPQCRSFFYFTTAAGMCAVLLLVHSRRIIKCCCCVSIRVVEKRNAYS